MKSLTKGHLKAGLDSLRGAKLRSFWTMMGVIIGVTSVITVVAIGEGIKQQIGGQLHSVGKDLITIRPAQLTGSSRGGNDAFNALSGLNINAPLTSKDVLTIGQTKGVAASAPLTIATGSVTGDNGEYSDGFVLGTTPDLPSLLNQSLAYGAFWTDQDDESEVAVLGPHAADKMFDTEVPLGYTFTYHGQKFIVRGIFNQFNATPFSQQADFNNVIFISQAAAEKLTNHTAPTYAILARPDKPAHSDEVAGRIRAALAKNHGNNRDSEVLTGSQSAAASNTVLDLLTKLIAGIAAISLLVGGIGIMNVMLVSVVERTHEIGIRKAVGATNRQILSQFMIESSLLTLAGGLIGIILAGLIDLGIRLTTNLQPVITWQVVVLASGVSLLVGIIFGTIPAIKAARKNPIEALRSE